MSKRETGYNYKCSLCNRFIRVRIPKGGDGSLVVPYKHKTESGEACSGHSYEAVLIDLERGD